MKVSNWIKNNNSYWDRVAKEYDSLYKDQWSKLENQFISQELAKLSLKDSHRVLDLGCGTGLGCRLCLDINKNIEYVGVDFSNEMIEIFKKNLPGITVVNTTMDNLEMFESGYFDLVISTFTAFSYTNNIELTLKEVKRVLKPNGKIFISVLNRWSLRRLLRLKFGKSEYYNTRNLSLKKSSFSWVLSVKEISNLLPRAHFDNFSIRGYNAFGGIKLFQIPILWPISLAISRKSAFLSHELLIISN